METTKNYESVVTNYGIVKLRKDGKSGNILMDYNYYNIEGKKKRRKKSLGIEYNDYNISDAKEWLLTLVMDKEGNFIVRKEIKSKNLLVSDFMKEVKEFFMAEKNRSQTNKTYVSMLENHFVPVFSNHYVHEITTSDLNALFLNIKNKSKYDQAGVELNVKTLRNIKTPISKFFQIAIDAKIITINPMININKSYFKNKKQILTKGKGYDLNTKKELIDNDENHVDPFTEDEIIKLLAAAKGKFRNFIGILFFTGMRPSELICLKWENIDIEGRFLIIEEARTGNETEEETAAGLTKTRSSKRSIDLSEKALHFIKEQYKYSGETEGELFKTQYGEPYKNHDTFTANDWGKLFDKVRKDKAKNHIPNNLNIRHRRLYQLRHSFASINLSGNKLPLLYVSKILGHRDPETTLRKYSKWVDLNKDSSFNMLDKATEAFDSLIA